MSNHPLDLNSYSSYNLTNRLDATDPQRSLDMFRLRSLGMFLCIPTLVICGAKSLATLHHFTPCSSTRKLKRVMLVLYRAFV
jgi:hypothetical protein